MPTRKDDVEHKVMIDPLYRAFAAEYIATHNATEAAISVGLISGEDRAKAARYACRTLKREDVQAYIKEYTDALVSEKVAGAQEVMEFLTSVMRNEETEEAVLAVGQGGGVQSVEKIRRDMSGITRVKSAELLAKCHGLMTDKVQVEGKIPVVIVDDVKE